MACQDRAGEDTFYYSGKAEVCFPDGEAYAKKVHNKKENDMRVTRRKMRVTFMLFIVFIILLNLPQILSWYLHNDTTGRQPLMMFGASDLLMYYGTAIIAFPTLNLTMVEISYKR